MSAQDAPGPMNGLRVIELCDEKGAFAGKLMADMGADVIKVEPPAGDPTRAYTPFAEDVPDVNRSLWFWHYNTSKRSITLDIEDEGGRRLLQRLIAGADFFFESEHPGRLARLHLDWPDLSALNPRLIMVSITPFGRSGPRADEEATDLTILSSGGPVWSCGYDDHTIPPVRGGGNQGHQTGCHFAVMAALVALLHRNRTNVGQHIDVNMNACANVTTEAGSYEWLVARATVQRQTGRHAGVRPSMPSQIQCADGRYVNSGVPPRTPEQFAKMYEWLESAGLIEEFDQAEILKAAAQDSEPIHVFTLMDNPEAMAKFAAGRDAVNLLAQHLSAYEFFVGGQERGFQFAIIYSPEEAIEDAHYAARGFPTEVHHPELGRSFVYPGAPYRFATTPWGIRRRAPLLGEDNAAVFGELGVSGAELEALHSAGVIALSDRVRSSQG